MKKFYNYIMLFAMALVAVSCSDEEPVAQNTAKAGDEVQFGLSLEELSRTIYGTESNDAFPIYWSQGDLVTVASPQCAVTKAEYEVTPVAGQSYAEALEKTGAAGVQWGSSNAYFYSIYPSANVTWKSLEDDNVTAKLNIGSVQSANIVQDEDGKTYSAADMDAVIMYAQTSEIQNGDVVNLQYNPYSTILEFEMTIGEADDGSYGSAKVLSITLTASEDTDIAGDFTLKFNANDVPTIEAAGNNSNSIKMDFATQPMLTEDYKSLKAKLAIIPDASITSIKNWKVTIEVVEGTNDAASTYTKTLDTESALKPGQIHKIKLPALTPDKVWDYDESNWITSLYDYKNIYLTELSLPGAWYAGGKIYTNSNKVQMNYQATNDVTKLWEAGVRAFATECRTSSTNTGQWYSPIYTPSSVVVSGTQQNGTILGTGEHCEDGTPIRTIIKSLADAAAASVIDDNGNVDGEFAVLVFSYADGGENGHRAQDHAYFIRGVQNEIDQSEATNIYDKEITANTTVYDVIGKLIIKINVDDRLPNDAYEGNMNALISYNPLITQLGDNVDYSIPLFSKMYWGAWNDGYRTTTTANANDFLWCFSSANRTQVNTGTDTTIPTYAQRKAALRGMMEHSREISADSGHNVWFYFNAGGTQTTSQEDKNTNSTSFATTMNSWLLDLVKLKANGGTDTNGVFGTAGAYVESDPSPLGIVMFNQCTSDTYKGPEIIKQIIEMNNKFKLQRYAGTSDDDGGANGELGEF